MNTSIEIVRKRFLEYGNKKAVYWNDTYISYNELYKKVDEWHEFFKYNNIPIGSVCAILGDFSPSIAALFFALMEHKCILVPFTKDVKDIEEFKNIANVEVVFSFNMDDSFSYERLVANNKNELIKKQINNGKSGLVVFSSGSTGKPKGILQDCENVMNKFLKPRKAWKTILFLMMDHFGGFNTFLSVFAYGGLAVCLKNHSVEEVCKTVEVTQADLLPTTPTFLNLLLASNCYKKYNLQSIKLITYGTEMMNETTLLKIRNILPDARLKQTYGLSELGVLRSKTDDENTTWLKVGGEEFKLKIIDNILWIKAESNMIGYLNAPNPFDEDGWFCTGDEVEQKGEYIRFLGRKSEIINVGGQKVFPAEVEAVILQDDNIDEATVYGKKHPIMGNIVAARVSLKEKEDIKKLSLRVRKLCSQKLDKYKIPIKFEVIDEETQHNNRFKKIRL
ncbi:MAG: fatty acid--CoA ligase family protein [Lachnospiraceae bacterium]|nr:fatty acid--CoA ligase family protein [Lachnospiraceae bacterium]